MKSFTINDCNKTNNQQKHNLMKTTTNLTTVYMKKTIILQKNLELKHFDK